MGVLIFGVIRLYPGASTAMYSLHLLHLSHKAGSFYKHTHPRTHRQFGFVYEFAGYECNPKEPYN